ncbi:MAG: pseudouridine synthase [Rickettsiales bacterium]|nr:pseudouridine synthase [Rickettsiales bacterium]|tara:strand:+ start:415 stop:1161 length:747 start_codon:yes stop_codon:yes gene_type:complete
MTKNIVRISKIISYYGFCSRREAEKLIEAGKVKINGKVVNNFIVNSDDIKKIEVENKELQRPLSTRMWLMNKPPGFICSNKKQNSKKIIFEIIPKKIKRVVLVGRLDMFSEGLILLTSNPKLSTFLENPRNKIVRKYIVEINEAISPEILKKTSSGIVIKGQFYNKLKIKTLKYSSKIFLKIELKEGKNREIRNIVEYCGKKIKSLKRLSFGPFNLTNEKLGEIREIPQKVLENKLKSLGLKVEDYFR